MFALKIIDNFSLVVFKLHHFNFLKFTPCSISQSKTTTLKARQRVTIRVEKWFFIWLTTPNKIYTFFNFRVSNLFEHKFAKAEIN